jgi:tRNA(fMet)-specific endonuclease VapC
VKILLDTNAYTAMKRGHREIADRVRNTEQVLLSAVMVGELLFGFRYGSRYQRNFDELEEFLASPFVVLLPVTMTTADRFGRIAASLRTNGTPIPTNDIWIAAHAFESGSELLSFDRHFDFVPGLPWTHIVS